MQTQHLNKFIFLLTLLLGYLQNAYSQIDMKNISYGDQLFKNNHLLQAEKIYTLHRKNSSKNTFEIDRKLAFIAKEKNDWLMELYFLSSMQSKQSKLETAKRLEEIARKRNLIGYELGIVERLKCFYFEYFPYLLLFLLLPALYVAYALIIKKVQNEKIPAYQVISYVSYIFLLFCLTNFPSFYEQGLTSSPKTYMRNFASSSAPVIKMMEKGTRVNYLYITNDWIPCFFEGKLGYIKSKDLLIIN